MKSVIAAGGAGMIVVKDAKETFYMLGQREGRFPSQRHFPPAVLAGPGTLASALGVAVAGAPAGTGPFLPRTSRKPKIARCSQAALFSCSMQQETKRPTFLRVVF